MTKTYAAGTQKNRINEVVILDTKNKCLKEVAIDSGLYKQSSDQNICCGYSKEHAAVILETKNKCFKLNGLANNYRFMLKSLAYLDMAN